MQMVRKAAGKHAFVKVTEEEKKAKSNLQLQWEWRIISHHLTLRMRRIQWYQYMAKWPEAHEQISAALFGSIACEEGAKIESETEKGKFAENAHMSNPWIKQLIDDLGFRHFRAEL